MIDVLAENWLSELLPSVVDLTRREGKAVMADYAEVDPVFEDKRDSSPLTMADLASHQVIVEGLTRLSPDWPVLSEESQAQPFEQRSSWRYFWLVDPLDGTKEFLLRNGEFTVNIALIDGNTPILGVVYAPAIDKLYFAARGLGAYRVDREITSAIQAKKREDGPTRVVVSRSHLSDEASIPKFAGSTENCEYIPMGSSLKFCLVAEGAADIYLRTGPTVEWDTAAAECILVEAGGTVTCLNGHSLEYNKQVPRNCGFVATAGA